MGTVACDCCKKHIIQAHIDICPLCKQPINLKSSSKNPKTSRIATLPRCTSCDLPFLATFVVGWRTGLLAKLIKDFKYQSLRAAAPPLVDLLDAIIPAQLDQKIFPPHQNKSAHIVVVPLPTSSKHIRERGLDHTKLLAQQLAHRRGWQYQPLLARAKNTVQVGAKASDRKTQANSAYYLSKTPAPENFYLLLDDIWTTGATMLAAAKLFQTAGANQLFAALLATGKPRSTPTSPTTTPKISKTPEAPATLTTTPKPS